MLGDHDTTAGKGPGSPGALRSGGLAPEPEECAERGLPGHHDSREPGAAEVIQSNPLVFLGRDINAKA